MPRRSSVAETGDGPLAGVRVVDLSTTFMGPYCTSLLAQMGADVDKVEPPGGDIVRGIGDRDGYGMGPIFLNANRGKRGIVLDLKDPADHATLLRLAARCDVFVHSMRPAAARRLGIGADTIAAVNPGCVYCALVGFGSDGPYRDRPAYDDVIQAVSGIAAVQGGDGDPVYVRTPMADKTVALMAVTAIVAALYERRAGGGAGQTVEVPMFETMATFMLLDQQGGHVFDPPSGPTGYERTASPHRRPYRTRDGHIGVLVYTDTQWRSFFSVIGRADLADDPRFRTIAERTKHIDQLYALLAEVMAAHTTDEWLTAFEAAGIPAMPVRSIAELFTDPHASAVGLLEHLHDPVLGDLRQPRLPVRFSRTRPGPASPAPHLDEHGEQIRAELDELPPRHPGIQLERKEPPG